MLLTDYANGKRPEPLPPMGLNPIGLNQTSAQEVSPQGRMGQIVEQADILEKRIAVHEELISALSERLSVVLSTPLPRPDTNAPTKGEPSCQLAQFLAMVTVRLSHQSEVLRDLLQRLEL